MIARIELELFKCFKLLKLPLGSLTLLSGANASGKSTVLQAMVLLHQTILDHEWSTRLQLNGSELRLGTVADVVDKVYGRREFYCHDGLHHARVTDSRTMPQVIQGMPHPKRMAWMQWITKTSLHWQNDRLHTGDDWLEENGDPVYTDHAVGEAAFCNLHGKDRDVVSFDPSDRLVNPIKVTWLKADETTQDVDVANHWTVTTVEQALAGLPNPFDSWESLDEHCRRSCKNLVFADEFMKFAGYPYIRSVAEGIRILVDVLDKVSDGIDHDGKRKPDVDLLYETYFVGRAPYFTDESSTNKRAYAVRLSFQDPTDAEKTVFCPWHGKVNSPTNFPPVRIHFSWPINVKGGLLLAYAGPKITMG